jgi:phosphatidate cytidylyltransferase
MVALAGAALWLGGWAFAAFAALVALGVYWELWCLVRGLAASPAARVAWMAVGAVYIGVAASALVRLREESLAVALEVVLMVIAVDIGAYFAGRAIGGPKIAPRISPSKTWAGLGGGIVAAALVHSAVMPWTYEGYATASLPVIAGLSLVAGTVVAVIAQCGDFFESWMKRRAGVKDSGGLIPGHGGLFDRVDGLVAVSFFAGLLIVFAG